jgi:PAS domain-containing protein
VTFVILSNCSCADYVKHLTAINKEKEESVKKAQCDLEATQRKLDGEKEQQDASEPESTTSSLTDSSGLAGAKAAKAGVEEKAAKSGGGAKRSSSTEANNNISHHKKPLAPHASFISSSMSSGGDDSGDQVPDSSSSSSASSNAAVKKVQGVTSVRSREAGHGDVVIENKRKRQSPPAHAEATSLEGNFELDYEEVFLNSNVPQVLATTSGKVVAWNDFFLRVTGFSKREMEQLTIFSLVQSSDLSSVFEIVAAALRTNALPTHEDTRIESSEKKTDDTDPNALQWDYEAMTLPCVKFRPLRESPGEKKPKQLNMTLTLMPDEDPRKRCFHGVFTDCAAGKKGSLGTISPELLSLLANQKDEHRPHVPKRKRIKHSTKESKEEFP